MFGINDTSLSFITERPVTITPVWLLGTNEVYTRRIRFLRASKPYIREFADLTPHPIGNFIYDGNILHNRWALWCGFTKVWSVMYNGAQFNLYLYYGKRW